MGDLNISAVKIPEQKYFYSKPFPLVLSPDNEANSAKMEDWSAWVQKNQGYIQKELLDHGAILFRKMTMPSADNFDSFVKSFGLAPFPYIGGAAPRNVVTGNVVPANEAPPSMVIHFHHEMAQVPEFPSVLFFFCNVAPKVGGQTPIAHSNMVYRRMLELEPNLVERLEKEGIRYVRVLPEENDLTSPIGGGWKCTYKTQDKEEAIKRAKEHGTTIEWLPDGCMKTTTKVLPAVRLDDRTGKKTWFNSIMTAYLGWTDTRNDRKKAVTFANGDQMNEQEMETLRSTLDDIAVDFTWQEGDVLMIDNRQALHARRPFTPPREILACLCKDFN